MKEPTQKYLKEHLDYNPETGLLIWIKPRCNRVQKGDTAGYTSEGYRRINAFGGKHMAHRIMWIIHYGSIPDGQIDHINGNRSDNRISNLRCVSMSENLKNKTIYKNNKTGVSGVKMSKGRYRTYISIGSSKKIDLGTFGNIFDAACARKSAEVKYGYHENHGRKPQDSGAL